ncbi:STAS domain-containing protein [Actinoplanes sp. NPDC051513]|uniref:STAS domain-containing protein n=1 Tax=Actinoplanes sp. NPDC051513 TaxID=3363908 RepID=UPI00379C3B04
MTGKRPLHVESTPSGPAAVCLTVSGELDAYTADDLARQVRETLVLERPRLILLDLNQLDFIDVTGVRTLYDLHFDAAAADCALTISQAPRTTRWILNVLGLDELFTIPARSAERAEPAPCRPRHAEPGS